MVGAVSHALIVENSFMSSTFRENQRMVLGTHADTDLVEPTLARDEDVPSTARLSDEEAEAVLDAYSAAVVAVAEREDLYTGAVTMPVEASASVGRMSRRHCQVT